MNIFTISPQFVLEKTALKLLSFHFFTQLGHCIWGDTRSEVEDSTEVIFIPSRGMKVLPLHHDRKIEIKAISLAHTAIYVTVSGKRYISAQQFEIALSVPF